MPLLRKFLKNVKGGRIGIFTHEGADVDAFAAGACMYLYLKEKYSPKLIVPEHININAKSVAKKTRIPYTITKKRVPDFDAMVFVDFNAAEMLGGIAFKVLSRKKPVLLVDHHTKAKKGAIKAQFHFLDSKALSSCELVLELFRRSHIEVSPKMAQLLAAGIVTDTAFFHTANHSTFKKMSFLLRESRKSFSQITALFRAEVDFSEKIASLKAAKRARIFKIGNWVAVTTDVGSFEASAASVLVRLGADVAFAGDCDNSKIRVSGRASMLFLKKTGFDLARDVFQPLSPKFSGSGGGHAGAAAFSGKAESLEPALQECLKLVQRHLKKKNRPFQLKEYT